MAGCCIVRRAVALCHGVIAHQSDAREHLLAPWVPTDANQESRSRYVDLSDAFDAFIVRVPIQIAGRPQQRGIERERSREEVQNAATDRQAGSAGVDRTTGGLEFGAASRQCDIEVWTDAVPSGHEELRTDVTEAEMSVVLALATIGVERNGEPLSQTVGDRQSAAGGGHPRGIRRLTIQIELIRIGSDHANVPAKREASR